MEDQQIVDDPTKINLYHFVYNVVAPITAPIGHQIEDDVSEPETEWRAPGGVAYRVNMQDENSARWWRYVRGTAKGCRGKFTGSLAEMLCCEHRKPHWFVSHWWGEPVLDFVMCLKEHCDTFKLDAAEVLYWVCAYANNQTRITHELGTEGPLLSPFFKALELAQGAVLVLDSGAEVVRRMWCGFENVVIAKQKKPVVLVTCVDGRGTALTVEPTPVDVAKAIRSTFPAPVHHFERQKGFPLESLQTMRVTRLQTAQTALPEDRVMITETVQQELGGFEAANSQMRLLAAENLAARGFLGETVVRELETAVRPFNLTCDAAMFEEAVERFNLSLRCCARLSVMDGLDDTKAACIGDMLGDAAHLAVLQLAGGSDFGNIGMIAISDALPTLLQLQQISLNLDQTQVTDGGAIAIGSALQHLKQLRQINLNFMVTKVTDGGAIAIGNSLQNLKQLQQITLKFRWTEVTDGGAIAIGNGLRGLEQLQQINLDFTLTQVTDGGAIAIGSALQHLKQLRQINLNFMGTKVTDGGAIAIGNSLQNLKQLQQITLKFRWTEVTDGGAIAIGNGLRGLEQLQQINLDFTLTQVTDGGAIAIGSALQHLKQLRQINLNFMGTKVADGGAIAIGNALQHLKQLQQITLDFFKTQVADGGAIAIGNGLRGLEQLQDIYMNFADTQVADGGAIAIGNGLQNLKQLQQITLNFGRTQVADGGAVAIGSALQHLKQLRQITLVFWDTQVTDGGAIAIGNGLQQLKQLQQIMLYFSKTQVADGGAIAIGNGLRGLEQLQVIYMNFADTAVTDETKQTIREALEKPSVWVTMY
eukprot:CAMPEP_0204393690 /NCGR_PEP_ID=MMETSP0469-20131031/62451_1 /ASSEMBLY_ACC=CAM_ASM_000384 /TAXON_ID=2969 /ORGANISM="Oxyrrhis marina" /LENGTH=816 /DNA_ID=CAMNT_0051387777 /DNA_START=147 /DNA_END=2597 /DNA_ORIENTATION=-